VLLKANLDIATEAEAVFDLPSDLGDGLGVACGSEPKPDLVALRSDVDDCAADVFSVLLAERLADHQQHQLQPEVGQLRIALLPLQVDQPTTSGLVVLVFPHRLDPALEEAVVASWRQLSGELDVVVQRPEVFDSRKVDDCLLVLLPVFVAVILEKPERPSVLQGMLGADIRHGESGNLILDT